MNHTPDPKLVAPSDEELLNDAHEFLELSFEALWTKLEETKS